MKKIATGNFIAIGLAVIALFCIEFVKPDSLFKPMTPKNNSALSDAITWAKSEYDTISEEMSELTTGVDFSEYKGDFKSANSLYKAGKYTQAKTAYEKILDDCPLHLGARSNYVLALAHCGDYAGALKNSVLLGLIHPGYEGNWVNILIPLYALGYGSADYSTELKAADFPSNVNLESDMDDKSFSDYIAEAYAYNRIYMEMEQELGGEKAVEAELEKYKNILLALRSKSPRDTDYSELLTYLEGLQKIRV